MKKAFPEYYPLTKNQKEKLWESGIFVFDASLLLDLYCYSEDTRNNFLDIIEKIKDQIWLPHQFAFEYQKNRLRVIYQQKKAYSDLCSRLESTYEHLLRNTKDRHPFLDMKGIRKKFKDTIDCAIKEIKDTEKKDPEWSSNDTIRNRLDSIFKDKIGKPCKNIEELEREGSRRYSKGTPPGFEDNKKEQNKYGDWFGWYQIMEMAGETQKSVVLVTSEQKKDWWLKNENEIIEPLPELRREILEKGSQFHIYTMETFLQAAKAKKTTLKEVREISKKSKELSSSDIETELQSNLLDSDSLGSNPTEA